MNVTCCTSAWVAYSRVLQASNGEQCNLMNEIFCILPTTALYISPVRTECYLRSEAFHCPAANCLQWKFVVEFFLISCHFAEPGASSYLFSIYDLLGFISRELLICTRFLNVYRRDIICKLMCLKFIEETKFFKLRCLKFIEETICKLRCLKFIEET